MGRKKIVVALTRRSFLSVNGSVDHDYKLAGSFASPNCRGLLLQGVAAEKELRNPSLSSPSSCSVLPYSSHQGISHAATSFTTRGSVQWRASLLPVGLSSLGRWSRPGHGAWCFSSTSFFSHPADLRKPKTSVQELEPIKKILIANRGEIACRVIKTCKRLGVKTVAVFSDQDKNAMHVRQADEAVYIGPPPAASSYLNGDTIVSAARSTGAQAIHPGYGFLSENVQFAELCKDQGISFIGPPSSAINAMGDKSVSKRMMTAAGVPVVPGYHGEDQRTEVLQHEAEKIGYPVLIKATQGGGGKGMRIVHSPEQFLENLAGAQREAKAAFDDDQVLIEKYLLRPRHIEVQIFGDKHGNVVHLFERDCSVQRRHQKIIEESPAPHITEGFRDKIGQAAINAAKAVGYESAGTVEFILDTLTGEFYFMEMNTRLQVEHPVTEMVTRQDLVEWQIRVANGERLPLLQDKLSMSGHAFEARIYAENVNKGFLPATGTLHHFQPPSASDAVRVETGVCCGDTVSVYYDPMIAKLVVWGHNRQAALTKLHRSLTDFQIAGLPNNIDFLKTLSVFPAFEAGEVETHFIDRFKSELLPTEAVSDESSPTDVQLRSATVTYGAAVVATAICLDDTAMKHKEVNSIWSHPSLSGFRLNHSLSRKLQLDWKQDTGESIPLPFDLTVTYRQNSKFDVQVGKERRLEISVTEQEVNKNSKSFRINIDGVSSFATVAQYTEGSSMYLHLWHNDQHHQFSMPFSIYAVEELTEGTSGKSLHDRKTGLHVQGAVTAPMAGRIVKVYVEDGAVVQRNDPLLVMEAMKMEHVVRAPTAGVVYGALAVGQQVQDGTVLLEIRGNECPDGR